MHKEKKHPPSENGTPLKGPEAEDGPPYKCPECGKEYDVLRFLGAHRWKAHKVEGESQRARQRAEKRAAEQHAPTDVKCDLCSPPTWHKDNRLLGLHKRVKHGIPGESHPSRQHKTPAAQATAQMHKAPIRTPEEKAVPVVTNQELDEMNSDLEKQKRIYRTVIEEIYNLIPEWFKTESPEVDRLRSVVEGLQEELGKVTRERDDLKARLDLMREAMGA